MSKSYKLKEGNYIDDDSIAHGYKSLKDFLEIETIYNSNGLILEKIGNIMHYYTTGYISKGQVEGYTIPVAYRPKNNIQTTCAIYRSNTYWTTCPFITSNKQVWIPEKAEGGLLTDYIYIGFSVFWFI